MSSTNEEIQNYFIKELALTNDLKNKICICDIINTNIYWNKTETNEIECLESCADYYEPEPLTHKCIEKCNPNKHYNFNGGCYKDNCPNGTKLNTTEEEISGKKICICNDLYYINETNNFMICCNEDNKELCLNIQITVLTTPIPLTSIIETSKIETTIIEKSKNETTMIKTSNIKTTSIETIIIKASNIKTTSIKTTMIKTSNINTTSIKTTIIKTSIIKTTSIETPQQAAF